MPSQAFFESVAIPVDAHDACVIHGALIDGLAEAQLHLSVIKISKDRELTPVEQRMLPWTMSDASREEVQEQIDPWCSLVSTYQHLIDIYDPDRITSLVPPPLIFKLGDKVKFTDIPSGVIIEGEVVEINDKIVSVKYLYLDGVETTTGFRKGGYDLSLVETNWKSVCEEIYKLVDSGSINRDKLLQLLKPFMNKE